MFNLQPANNRPRQLCMICDFKYGGQSQGNLILMFVTREGGQIPGWMEGRGGPGSVFYFWAEA